MLHQIRKEISSYCDTDITIVDGFSFNQKRTIERIYRYYNSKFENGDIDIEGNKKFFFNITQNPCRVETKATDFDTKHVKILPVAGSNPKKAWFMERDLKFWMKDKNFGKVLNRIFEERPKFGSVVLKTIKGTPRFVDLRNFFLEQSADNLDNSSFIIEKHIYTPRKLRKIGAELGWENVEEAIKLFRDMVDNPHIVVYERYGDVYNEKTKKYQYKRVCIADVGIETDNPQTHENIPYGGITLEEREIETHPYDEFHRGKIPGRWLGVGIVESLFDPQVRENQIANLEAKGDYYASLHIWQTADDGVNINLSRDVIDGEILSSESGINPVDVAERNLSYFKIATDKWMQNRDEITLAYDVIQGQRLPAGTPLGSAKLAAGMAGSHFDQLREDIALDVKEYLFKKIVPGFIKQNSGKHVLRIAGEDLDKVRSMLISQKAVDALFDFIKRKGKLPLKTQYEAIKLAITENVNRGKEKILSLPGNFYKDLKYKIDIIIDGEQKDVNAWAQTMMAGLQAITADPTLLTDPIKKKFFGKFLQGGGASITDFEPDQPAEIGRMALPASSGAGGGVSRPTMMASNSGERTL